MVCDFDFPQMRPLGFNSVRLNLSWSLLEPQPGQISSLYLDRIAQTVGWARAQGIYMVLDVHQDAWSKYLYTPEGQTCPPPTQAIRGYDGAPEWASQHASPVCALAGVRELDNAVAEDFSKLYADAPAPDGVGLQEHYAHVLSALAQRFRDEPAVVGYEIINEPHPGFNAVPGEVDSTQLFPFYGKVVNTVVRDVPRFRQLFFIEPNAERNLTDNRQIVTPWSAYSPYPNVVYAPHIYTGVFTLDQLVASQRFFPSEGGYNSAIADAQALGLPLWVGEFGNNPSDDETILRTHYTLQDKDGVGGSLWLWKENANDVNGAVYWGVYARPFGKGVPQPKRLKFVDRAYPLLTAGALQSFTYDSDQATLDMRATSAQVAAGDRRHAALVFVPEASRGDVRADGASLEVFDRGPAREVYVFPSGGAYHVYQGPPVTPLGPPVTPLGPVVSAPAAQACRSRRSLVLHVRSQPGAPIRQITVYVNGRRAPARVRRRRGGTVVDLRGLPRGTFRVRIVVRTIQQGRARSLSRTRRYHTCASRGRGRAHRRPGARRGAGRRPGRGQR
jgi:endoglycosylceramidase